MDTKAIEKIGKELAPIATKAQAITITSPKEMKVAASIRIQLKEFGAALKKRKEEITKPLNTALKSARALFEPHETKIDDALSAINTAMSLYQTAEDRRVRAEEAKIAARVGQGSGHLKAETAVAKMDAIERPQDRIDTESGGVTFRTDRRLKITDVDAMRNYIFKEQLYDLLTLNESALLKHLKAGYTVAGVEIEEVKIPVNAR